jgi:hypothetical protein
MSLDLNKSFNDANSKIKSYNTYKDSRSEIKKRFKSAQSDLVQQTDDLKNTIPVNPGESFSYAKNEAFNQLDKLINMYTNSQQPGQATLSFLLTKFIKSFKILRPQLKDIFISCILEKLNCDYDSEYSIGNDGSTVEDGNSVFVRIQGLDFQQILKIDPNSRTGKVRYERTTFNSTQINSSPKSTNNLLWNLLQNPNVWMSQLYNGVYKGSNNQKLFDIRYVSEITDVNGGQIFGDFFEVKFKKPINSIGQFENKFKVYDFLKSYYNTIDVFDIKSFFNALLDNQFNMVDIDLKYGTKTLTDKTKFGLFVQRMLGQCYDNDTEISVAGNSKLPELDDTSNRFFDLTYNQEIFIEAKNALIRKGVVVFENCDKVELPIADEQLDYLYSLNETVTETNIENYLSNTIITTLSTDPSWSLTFPYPNRLKISFLRRIISEFPLSVTMSVMGPKQILPLFVMLKALNIDFGEFNINSRVDFMVEFRKFFECISSKIMSHFIKILYTEIKKDIKNLVKALYIDISGDATASIYIIVEQLVSLTLIVAALIKDYKRCKSIIDGILALLNLAKNAASNFIPTPLLLLTDLLPGFSPTRAFVNHIENMEKLGLPTGPGPDGSPNLELMKDFSIISAFHKEMIQNGKMSGAAVLTSPPPGTPTVVKLGGKFL